MTNRRSTTISASMLFAAVIQLSSFGCIQEAQGAELSVLGGVTILFPQYGDNTSVISLPNGAAVFPIAPAVRLTARGANDMIVDWGFSVLSLSEGNDTETILTLEAAPGFEIGRSSRSKAKPFMQGIVGILSESNGDSHAEIYLGGQLGVRQTVTDHTAARFQVGYRRLMGDRFDFGSLEIAGGLSFKL